MARVAEDRSRAECDRLQALIDTHARGNRTRRHSHRAPMMGTAKELATAESHYFDLVALPWGEDALSAQALAQSLVFGSGVPVVLVPPARGSLRLDHIAVARESRPALSVTPFGCCPKAAGSQS